MISNVDDLRRAMGTPADINKSSKLESDDDGLRRASPVQNNEIDQVQVNIPKAPRDPSGSASGSQLLQFI